MPLEMKSHCERCHDAVDGKASAYICSFECTYCSSCARQLLFVCPNCGGELVPRPKRPDVTFRNMPPSRGERA
jgi:hypothetical protein